nr:MAG TPA: hypothetical protein [Caudoviricetes sp.]
MMRWHWRISEKVRLTKVRKKKAQEINPTPFSY